MKSATFMTPPTLARIQKSYGDHIGRIETENNPDGLRMHEIELAYAFSEFAYVLGNQCPNNQEKLIALGLLDKIRECVEVSCETFRKETDGK